MNIRKERLDTSRIVWDVITNEPLWSKSYGVGRKEWDKWVSKMGRRCGYDWVLCQKMVRWKRKEAPFYVGPKVRKRRNMKLRYRWSCDFVEEKCRELTDAGYPQSYGFLAWKLNMSVSRVIYHVRRLGMRLNNKEKPVNLNGKYIPVTAFGKG